MNPRIIGSISLRYFWLYTRHLALLSAAILFAASGANAGLVFEFDGQSWHPKPKPKDFREAEGTTVCLIIDSGSHFEQLLPVLTKLNPNSPPSLKIQARDQIQSVTLDLSLPSTAPEELPPRSPPRLFRLMQLAES